MKYVKIAAYLLLFFLMYIIVGLQVDYETAIRGMRKKCTSLGRKERLKYTPVAVYKVICLVNKETLHRDRLLSSLLVNDCLNIPIMGYHTMYVTHVFLSDKEKDSLLLGYDAEIKKSRYIKGGSKMTQ
jgi:hypothetical protein